MDGVRRGARAVLRWFSPLYVVLIVIQVFLVGEGIFRSYVIKHSDDCNSNKASKLAHCTATPAHLHTKTLDAHRFFGFLLTEPIAILFLIAALLAWYPNVRIRILTILAPILTFLQLVFAAIGGWVAGLHPVNAFIVLGLYGYLTRVLRSEAAETVTAPAPATAPAG